MITLISGDSSGMEEFKILGFRNLGIRKTPFQLFNMTKGVLVNP
jgi:hypothetical protein